ncbi:MAG: hypothetical protein GQ574_14575 [Crocinitomix sp.]|nr:hypothetical protein [Crocinitomix sp.]
MNEREYAFLKTGGYSGQLNYMWWNYLEAQGYSGTLTDKFYAWALAGYPLAGFSFADLPAAKMQWLDETAADLALDVPPDVTELINRIAGEPNAIQLATVNMLHDGGAYVEAGAAQYATMDLGGAGSSDYLISCVVNATATTKVRRIVELTDAAKTYLIQASVYSLVSADGFRFASSVGINHLITGLTVGNYYAITYGHIGGEFYYGVKGENATGLIANVTGTALPTPYHFLVGNVLTVGTAVNIASAQLALGGIEVSDYQNVLDESYDWGVAQGLIT